MEAWKVCVDVLQYIFILWLQNFFHFLYTKQKNWKKHLKLKENISFQWVLRDSKMWVLHDSKILSEFLIPTAFGIVIDW